MSTPRFTARQGDIVVLAMTSQRQAEAKLQLWRWQSAGLPKPTWLKPVIGTLARKLILRRLGRLQAADLPRVRLALRQAIAAMFLT